MPKILTMALVPTYKRTLQSVGKTTFVHLSCKPSTEWSSCLHAMQFINKKTGKLQHYTPNTISHKLCNARKLYGCYNPKHILLDIYHNPSRVSIRVRYLAGKQYKTLVPGAKLPPMIIKKTKKCKKTKKIWSPIIKK